MYKKEWKHNWVSLAGRYCKWILLQEKWNSLCNPCWPPLYIVHQFHYTFYLLRLSNNCNLFIAPDDGHACVIILFGFFFLVLFFMHENVIWTFLWNVNWWVLRLLKHETLAFGNNLQDRNGKKAIKLDRNLNSCRSTIFSGICRLSHWSSILNLFTTQIPVSLIRTFCVYCVWMLILQYKRSLILSFFFQPHVSGLLHRTKFQYVP